MGTYSCVFVLIFAFISLTAATLPVVPTLKLHDGKEIPAIALGTWLGNNSKPGVNEVENSVTWAIDAGYRHIDTAFAYKIEDQVGRALAKKIGEGIKREELFITTKLWNSEHAKEAVVPALRASLADLGLDYVDLYLVHWPVGQFINLNLQQPELLSYCARQDIRVMGYTPFGSLFYSKAKPDAPPPRVDDPALLEIAKKYNKTVPQVSLRYLIELGVIPLPKSLTKSRVEQNIDVFNFSLTQEERDVLKSFDRNYRTIPQLKWLDHPYFPFEKPQAKQ